MSFVENLSTIAGWVWINTLKASVLVGIILLIQYFFRRQLSAKWHYTLWLVLIARLLLPAGFESQLSIYNIIETKPESIKNISQPFTRIVWQSPDVLPVEENGFYGHVPVSQASLKVADILVIIWAIGVIILLGLTINGNRKFWLKIRNREAVNDSSILQLFNTCLERMQIRRHICLQHLPPIQIPMVYGWLKPAILLPSSFIKGEKTESLKHILCHELAHIKRHDILVSYVTTLLQILHWFNPLMWWAFYKIRLDREVACDAIALNHLGREQAKSYGHTILSLLEHISTENLMPLTVGIIESKKNLKRRLARIIQFKKPKIIWSLLALLILSTITVAGLSEALNNEKNYKSQENDYFQSEDTLSTALQTIVIEGKDKIFFQADSMHVVRSDSTVSILTGDSIVLVTGVLKSESNKQEIITGRNVSLNTTDQNQMILTGYDIKIDTVGYIKPEIGTTNETKEADNKSYNIESDKKESQSSWLEKMLLDSEGGGYFKDFKSTNPDTMFQAVNYFLSLFEKTDHAYSLYLNDKKLKPGVDYWIDEGSKLQMADHIKIEKESEIRLQWYPQTNKENEIKNKPRSNLEEQNYKGPYPENGMRAFYKSVGYPKKMRKAGVTGHIYALLYLNKTGSVDSLIEIKSRLKNKEYYPEFFEALREAVHATKWKPATVFDDQPINSFVELWTFFPANQWYTAPDSAGREGKITIKNVAPGTEEGRYFRLPYTRLIKDSETLILNGHSLERGVDYWPDDVMTLKLADHLELDENSKIIFKFRYLEN